MRSLVYDYTPDPRDTDVLKDCFIRSAIRLADRLTAIDDVDRLDSLFAVFTQIDAELQRLDRQPLFAAQLAFADAQLVGYGFARQLAHIVQA